MPASGLRRYEPTNSRPAGGLVAVLIPHLEGSLPPEPFPLDNPAQRLTAGGAAKPLAGTAPGPGEVLVAAGTIAAEKIRAVGWALALAPQSDTRMPCPGPWGSPLERGWLLPDDARHSDSDTADTEPDVFPARWKSADTAGWLLVAAIAALPLGTRGYRIGPGAGWVERAARIPRANNVSGEADEPLDGRQDCGSLDVGPRKRLTSDGQASDAESLLLRSEAPFLIPSALVAVPTLQRKGDPPRCQVACPGTTSTKLIDYGLGPGWPKQLDPR
jgi:hypothetical protein